MERRPVKRRFDPALLATALATLALSLAGCSDRTTVRTTEPEPPTTTTAAAGTTSAATTSTSAPPTTSTAATTSVAVTTSTVSTVTTTPTRATEPREPWVVPGQRYYFPVQPPEVADYGSTHHDYPATDIFAPVGTTLVAVTDGIIDEVGRVDAWDPDRDDPATRSGLYVSIVGTDGVRYYYSHLDSVEAALEAGQPVRAGQRVGTVGVSGNARFTSPHVHFGLSEPTFPGDWEVRRGRVPPYEYLQAWTAGEDVIPDLSR